MSGLRYLVCAVGWGLFFSQLNVMFAMRPNRGRCALVKQNLEKILTPTQTQFCQAVFRERLRISISSFVLSILVSTGIFLTLSSPASDVVDGKADTFSFCTALVVFLGLYILFYMIWPKKMYMVPLLTKPKQFLAWWAIYRCMQSSMIGGFVFGVIIYGVIVGITALLVPQQTMDYAGKLYNDSVTTISSKLPSVASWTKPKVSKQVQMVKFQSPQTKPKQQTQGILQQRQQVVLPRKQQQVVQKVVQQLKKAHTKHAGGKRTKKSKKGHHGIKTSTA